MNRYQADRDVQMAKRREELMQAGGAIHVTRSTRFLPLEVSVVLPQVCHFIIMPPPTGLLPSGFPA